MRYGDIINTLRRQHSQYSQPPSISVTTQGTSLQKAVQKKLKVHAFADELVNKCQQLINTECLTSALNNRGSRHIIPRVKNGA